MRLYLDSSVIRRCIEGTPHERLSALRWVKQAEDSPGGTILCSRLVRAECLVMPIRVRDAVRIQRFKDIFQDYGIVLVGVTDEVLDLATEIFADYRIKMADAIHTATAIVGNCDALVARDDAWIRKGPVMGLPLLPFSDPPS